MGERAQHVKSLATGELLRQAKCNRCGSPRVAWVKSKNGQWYLCELFPKKSTEEVHVEVMRAVPWVPHSCQKYIALQAKRTGAEVPL